MPVNFFDHVAAVASTLAHQNARSVNDPALARTRSAVRVTEVEGEPPLRSEGCAGVRRKPQR